MRFFFFQIYKKLCELFKKPSSVFLVENNRFSNVVCASIIQTGGAILIKFGIFSLQLDIFKKYFFIIQSLKEN